MNLDKLKMLFGIGLLGALALLATLFGLGHVEEKTSYGLMPIVTTLSTLAGGFAQWAFGSREREQNETKHSKEID